MNGGTLDPMAGLLPPRDAAGRRPAPGAFDSAVYLSALDHGPTDRSALLVEVSIRYQAALAARYRTRCRTFCLRLRTCALPWYVELHPEITPTLA